MRKYVKYKLVGGKTIPEIKGLDGGYFPNEEGYLHGHCDTDAEFPKELAEEITKEEWDKLKADSNKQ